MTWEEAVAWCLDNPDFQDLARNSYFGDPIEAASLYRQSAEFAAIKRLLPSTKGKAVDLGAGNGILSWALATEGWTVTAVEPDESSLVGTGAIRKLCEHTNVVIETVNAYGENIPLMSGRYDLVIARQAMHHANNLPKFCLEMQRLSSPSGVVLTLRDHVISSRRQLSVFLNRHPLHHLYGGENAYTLRAYRNALKTAGLRVRREMVSFASPINYAPLSDSEVVRRLADTTGPVRAYAAKMLNALPFTFIAKLATIADRRPGRLVTFVCGKK